MFLAARARHARRSDPLSSKRTAREAGRTFQKTTAFVATALVPFAAKVSVVPCCSVRFGTAEREQAERTVRYTSSAAGTELRLECANS